MDESELNEQSRAELAERLGPLRSLLHRFVAGEVNGYDFDTQFFGLYQDLDDGASDAVFAALERFFGAADDHVPDPESRDAPDDLSTEELRARAAALLRLAGLA